jgi:hypothetical protein
MWQLRDDGCLVDVTDGFESNLVVDFETPHPRPDITPAEVKLVRRYVGPDIDGDLATTDEAPRGGTYVDDGAADRWDRIRGGREFAEHGFERSERTARRARGRVRRWCVSNKATRLLSLTYRGDGQRSFAGVQLDIARFRRRMRAAHPTVALLTTAEWHPGSPGKPSHGWHVHVLASRYVAKGELAALWGLGFVDVRKIRSTEGGKAAARAAARYVAKYLGKDQDGGERPPGAHAYEVTQGTQPMALRVSGVGYGGVYAGLAALMPGPIAYQWSSEGSEGWLGPPTAFLSS